MQWSGRFTNVQNIFDFLSKCWWKIRFAKLFEPPTCNIDNLKQNTKKVLPKFLNIMSSGIG